MSNDDPRAFILKRLEAPAQRLGLEPGELVDDLDLLRSGLLDSLGFVDLVAELEEVFHVQVDLEQALGRSGSTTLHGVIRLFS